jgi:hypothetical protein
LLQPFTAAANCVASAETASRSSIFFSTSL